MELLAEANEERSKPDRYFVLESDVDEAMTTLYVGDDPVRRRWPHLGFLSRPSADRYPTTPGLPAGGAGVSRFSGRG